MFGLDRVGTSEPHKSTPRGIGDFFRLDQLRLYQTLTTERMT